MDRLIEGVKPFTVSILDQGVYIMMLRALNKPPHFLLLIDGYVYGISVKGPSIQVPVQQYHHWIQRKGVKTLWIKLEDDRNVSIEAVIEEIKSRPIVNLDGITCLQPIKFYIEQNFGISTKHVQRIFDLLDLLNQDKLVTNIYESNIQQETIIIEEYTTEDIQKGIIQAMQKHLYARK